MYLAGTTKQAYDIEPSLMGKINGGGSMPSQGVQPVTQDMQSCSTDDNLPSLTH